ncbi:MAG: spore coat associated protein CotJA [Clostridiaceae bacterium]
MAKDVKSDLNMATTICKPEEKCIPQETVIKNVRLAAAYVPYQQMCTLLSPLDALKHGTAFPELYSPYEGKYKKNKSCSKR